MKKIITISIAALIVISLNGCNSTPQPSNRPSPTATPVNTMQTAAPTSTPTALTTPSATTTLPQTTTPAPTVDDRIVYLKSGDKGDKVKELQISLNKFNYKLVVDGVFGTFTDFAVKDFQRKVNILSDGIAGPETFAKLASTPAQDPYLYKPTPTPALTPTPKPTITPEPTKTPSPTPKPSSTPALDNTKLSWYYIPNTTHKVPEVNNKINISKYGGYYVGNTSIKNIYLTMDLGYEAGYTNTILDILKANNVKVTFFVTKSYIDNNPQNVNRMVNEGHIVGNHTSTHPSLPSIASDISSFNNEILSTAASYKNVTGKDMVKVLRPPMGEYSELSLYMTQQLGYKSIFWSFAYFDYDLNNQPDKTYAFNLVTSSTHNGAIMLLHGISKTNTEILNDVINNIKSQGYQFITLDKLQ